MLIIFVVAVFVLGPYVPRISESIRSRTGMEDTGYPLPLIIAFGLSLVVSLIYGILNTIPLFQ
jgi:hypothetical protein